MPIEDIRQFALEMDLAKEAFWVERWKTWINIWELTGEERESLLDNCIKTIKGPDGKLTGKVDLKLMYPMLTILSIHYPESAVLPDPTHPHYQEYPGVNGTPSHPRAGKRIFAVGDRDMLNKRSGAVLEMIAAPARRLSGLDEDSIGEKKETSVSDLTVDSTLSYAPFSDLSHDENS